eukprot:PhM_4_TR15607/c0_g1_i1/m.13845
MLRTRRLYAWLPKQQPFNPLYPVGDKSSTYIPQTYSADYKKIPLRVRRRNPSMPARQRLSEAEIENIIHNESKKKWWRPLYAVVEGIKPQFAHSMLRWCQFGMIVLAGVMVTMLMYMYEVECDMLEGLSERDQEDYKIIVRGANASEFKSFGDAVLDKEDPMNLKSHRDRVRLVIRAAVAAGWLERDFDLERRARREGFDPYGFVYWMAMNLGKAVYGKGDYW